MNDKGDSGEGFAIVFDINGVLGEVRKSGIKDRIPSVVMPTGQKFYARPNLLEFIQSLSFICPLAKIVVWTSRYEKNARLIRRYLDERCGFHRAIAYLYGEDCPTVQAFHPIKDAQTLRARVPSCSDKFLVWVDDHAERILIDDRCALVNVETYEAIRNPDDFVSVVFDRIKTIISTTK